MFETFGPQRGNNPEQATRIKAWAWDAFAADEGATVMVSELRCTEPGCPPLETVIALLGADGTRQFKLHKALADVTQSDVQMLAAAATDEPRRL
jgi:hypothetical protein